MPNYAGAYTYGRIQTYRTMEGKKRKQVSDDKWISFIENHHEAYITMDEFRNNCSILSSNNTRDGASPSREGNALLQGIAICAKCGNRLSVTYKKYKSTLYGIYMCGHIRKGEPYSHKQCICINGRAVDAAVSDIILQRLTPEAVKAALEIQQELEKRKSISDNYFILQVERAGYEAGLVKKRYMNAEPDNRLVCVELERLWNEKMGTLLKTESELREHEKKTATPMKTDIGTLLNFPEKLHEAWCNNDIGMTDKKRIIRCLVEDVVLDITEREIIIGIRFKGGIAESIKIIRPPKKYETWTTEAGIAEYIREASKYSTVEEMVEHLNQHGKTSGKGLKFTLSSVRGIQYSYNIPSLKEYLRSLGYLSTEEKAKQMGISMNALNKRRTNGKYKGECIKTTGGGDFMYEP